MWHWHSNGTGVAEVMPSKVSLVTQLFLNPERKRRRERDVEQADIMQMRMTTDEAKRREERYKSGIAVASNVKDFLCVSIYINTQIKLRIQTS